MTSAARDLLLSIQSEQASGGIESEYVFLNVRTGKPYTDVKKGFSAACREAQVADFRFHDLRHTAATWIGESGASASYIKALLGHSSIQTSERYTHATDEGLRRAVEALARRHEQEGQKVVPLISRFKKEAAG